MAAVGTEHRVGSLLRAWRDRRRMTQMELALDAGISTRHLSFVETGRSKPGRELLMRIAEQLKLPLRERNHLLLAAGHAPAFPERSLDDPELAPVRETLDLILSGHEPYPAIVVDRRWNIVAANSAVTALTETVDVDPALLEPPVNAVKVGLHPRGLGPVIVDIDEWRAFFRQRIEQQLAVTADEELAALLEEIDSYATPDAETTAAVPAAGGVLGPVRVRAPDGREMSFVGMFASFDTPFDVTTSELAMELLFPADQSTAEALKALARDRRGG